MLIVDRSVIPIVKLASKFRRYISVTMIKLAGALRLECFQSSIFNFFNS